MERNLATSRIEEDYRLWFESSMLLPDFDVSDAITKLRVWSQRFGSWRAYYYLYVLYFNLWYSGASNSLSEMEDALDQCKKRTVGRKNLSEQWMAIVPPSCPVVSSLDLQPWDEEREFWLDGNRYLARVNGLIRSIEGPQAGVIRIDGVADAFFVPVRRQDGEAVGSTKRKAGFERHTEDVGAPVNFFLGFSPSGLRAWEVQSGHVAGADRKSLRTGHDALTPETLPEAPPMPQAVLVSRIKKLKGDVLVQHARDLVQARTELGAFFLIDELSDRLEADFGIDGLQGAGIEDLSRWLTEACGLDVLEDGTGYSVRYPSIANQSKESKPRYAHGGVITFGTIRAYDAEKHFGQISSANVLYTFTDRLVEQASKASLRQANVKGRVVEFMRSESENPVSRIRILPTETTLFEGTVLDPEETRKGAMSEIVRYVQAADLVPARTIEEKLHSRYLGAIPLCHRLNYKNFVELLADVPDVKITWKEHAPYVTARRVPQLGGRLGMTRVENQPDGRSQHDSAPSTETPKSPPSIESLIRARVEGMLNPGERIALTSLGDRIVDIAGPGGRNLKAAGYMRLSDALRQLNGFTLSQDAGVAYLTRSRELANTMPRPEPERRVRNRRDQTGATSIEDRVRERLEEILPSPNDRLAVAAVGNTLADLLGPGGKNLKAAGYQKLGDLLRRLEGFEVTGVGPGIQVGRSHLTVDSSPLREPMQKSVSGYNSAAAPRREKPPNRTRPSEQMNKPTDGRTQHTSTSSPSIRNQVRQRLIDLLPTPGASLPLTTIGAKLTDIVGVDRKAMRAAGYPKLTDLLREIDGFTLSGESATMRISRSTGFTD